jgi:hypothetical protein
MNMGLGAHVEEADLTALTQDDMDGLRTALLEHGLLVIRATGQWWRDAFCRSAGGVQGVAG